MSYGPCQADGCDDPATHLVDPGVGQGWYGCAEHSGYAVAVGFDRRRLE